MFEKRPSLIAAARRGASKPVSETSAQEFTDRKMASGEPDHSTVTQFCPKDGFKPHLWEMNAANGKDPACKHCGVLMSAVKAAVGEPVSNTAKKKQPKSEGDTITYLCKHKIGIAYLEGRNCPECKDKARREKNRKKHEKHAAERAADEPKRKLDDQGRLPDGSMFIDVVYDAEKVMWRGRLVVPNQIDHEESMNQDGSCKKCFDGQASGVEKLLRMLANQYRQWA